jgi:cellulose synthase/poly-beta-1,6-N-acetylglucosamine synthase-like glycosyltransferase
MVILALKLYLVFVVLVLLVYAVRHFIFTVNRTVGEQRLYYQDIHDSDLPTVSVLIPMYNEKLVAKDILNAMVSVTYPKGRFEVIPINDHSTDTTGEILDEYALKHPMIKPLHRHKEDDQRGKQAALNEAMQIATGEIIVVFDADYIPQKGCLRDLAVSFIDPEVGAVMGRVIPYNLRPGAPRPVETDPEDTVPDDPKKKKKRKRNLLTRLLDLERTGGYQVDQQARHNLQLMPQYGGTVGAFRKKLVIELGGFDRRVLAEDTDLTYMLYTRGWKVLYANRVECYEQCPEEWRNRRNQIYRWSRGHNHVLFKHFFSVLDSRYLSFREKFDGMLLLCLYLIPFFILTGFADSIVLFFLGEMQIVEWIFIFFFVAGYNTFGNFAPFYQIGSGALLDGSIQRVRLLPFLLFYFIQNIWTINQGLFRAVIDRLGNREVLWDKTERAKSTNQ